MPWPIERRLEMVAPTGRAMLIQEPPVPSDPDSTDIDQTPTFNAYSADGDVTGEVVYVNYGVPADYEQLEKLGVSVKGKIVLARYGGSWRGIKPKVAYEHGAIGCLIFSDPKDDGFFQGEVYPDGPYRPEFGVQRGSVMDMPIHTGDPLTPGWGATAGGKKLPVSEAQDDSQDSRDADRLGRRAADLPGHARAGGARGVARRHAGDLPPRRRTGEDAPEARSTSGSRGRSTT